MVDPAKQAERDEAVAATSSIEIMEDAPWAPVFNEQRFTMHSPRHRRRRRLFIDPVHIPVNYDYIYAKDVPVSCATTPSTSDHHHFGWDNAHPARR